MKLVDELRELGESGIVDIDHDVQGVACRAVNKIQEQERWIAELRAHPLLCGECGAKL